MTTKTTGAEFKRFYSDPEYWPETEKDGQDGPWHEDEIIEVDGQARGPDAELSDIADTAAVRIDGGAVYGSRFKGDGPSLETYFKRWRKAQTTCTLVIECDIGKRDEIVAALKKLGAKVLG